MTTETAKKFRVSPFYKIKPSLDMKFQSLHNLNMNLVS